MPRPTICRLAAPARRAFSLVEMLTVIGILVIVLSIIIPAMNSARKSAKNADTRATLSQLQQAVASFNTDNRRDPGYFSPKLMGSTDNANRGFTTMDNIMLDLQGGVVAPNAPNSVTMGPGANAGPGQVQVDLGAFGSTHQSVNGAIIKNYFTADAKKMIRQDQQGQRHPGGGAGTGTDMLPSLVDAYRDPILAWQQDDPNAPTFAAMASPPPNTPNLGAQFYWNQNAGFLSQSVTHLGQLAENQAFPDGSLLAATAPGLLNTMTALLGNPAAPNTAVNPVVPLSPRGPIVFQSAGSDGVFVGKHDKGGGAGSIIYAANTEPFNNVRFDDIIMSAGH